MDIMMTEPSFSFFLIRTGIRRTASIYKLFRSTLLLLLLDPPPPTTTTLPLIPLLLWFRKTPKFPPQHVFSCHSCFMQVHFTIARYPWLLAIFPTVSFVSPIPAALSVAFLSLSFSCAKILSYTLFCLGFVCLPAVSVFLGYFG